MELRNGSLGQKRSLVLPLTRGVGRLQRRNKSAPVEERRVADGLVSPVSRARYGSASGGDFATARARTAPVGISFGLDSVPSREVDGCSCRPILQKSRSEGSLLSPVSSRAPTPPNTVSNRAKQLRTLAQQMRQESNGHSKEQLAAVVTDALEDGLSWPAVRENIRGWRYKSEIERAEMESFKQNLAAAAQDASSVELFSNMTPEVFEEECNSLGHLFEEYVRSVRLDHLEGNSAEERKRAEKEAERRRLEEAARKARKREQAARDPHRKVALRIENKRRFEPRSIGKGVPMQVLEIQRHDGTHEQIPLVNVRCLKSMARGLEAGMGVLEMLEDIRRQDAFDAFMSMKPPAASSMTTSSIDVRAVYGPDIDKMDRAAIQREQEFIDRLFRKLGTMRSALPYALPFRFVVKEVSRAADVDGSADPHLLLSIGPPQRSPETLKEKQLLATALCNRAVAATVKAEPDEVAGASEKSSGGKKKSSPVSRARNTILACSELHKLVHDVLRNDEELIKNTPLVDRSDKGVDQNDMALRMQAIASEALRNRAKKMMSRWKSSVRILMLYFVIVRKSQSADILVCLLRQLGEWARVRQTIQKFRSGIRRIQRGCREFLSLRRRRLDVIAHEWDRLEEAILSNYFRKFRNSVINSKVAAATTVEFVVEGKDRDEVVKRQKKYLTQSEKAQRDLYKAFQEDASSYGLDWRIFKLPLVEREVALQRWYIFMLKKSMNASFSFVQAIRNVVKGERELFSYLKFFNPDAEMPKVSVEELSSNERAMSARSKPHTAQWWVMKEDSIVVLMMVLAQALVLVEPYREHPANNIKEGDAFFPYMKILGEQIVPAPLMTYHEAKGEDMSESQLILAYRSKNRPGMKVDLDHIDKLIAQWASKHREVEPSNQNKKRSLAGEATSPVVPDHPPGDLDSLFSMWTPRLRNVVEEQAISYRLEMLRAEQQNPMPRPVFRPGDIAAATEGHEYDKQ